MSRHSRLALPEESSTDLSGFSLIEFPPEICLHELFQSRAQATPEAVAVVCGADQITYGDLAQRSDDLARILISNGVEPEKFVGICVERSLDMVVALLATLKAGGAYVPLDPDYPPSRLHAMVADAHPTVVLTTREHQARLRFEGPVTLLDPAPQAASGTEVSSGNPNPATGCRPDHPAYVIYTSGSTGQPKGVMITHRCVTRLFSETQNWFHFGPTDIWTMFHSFSFDFSVWEIWGPLLTGGRLVIVPKLVSRSPDEFLELLVRERVTILNQTPSAFYQLIQADADRPSLGAQLALRTVIFGGEALTLGNLTSWYQRHDPARPQLVNMYGITETTVHVTWQPLTPHQAATVQESLIGREIPDLRIYVLDERLQQVAVGVTGEMYVGGPGLSRGYLGRPGLTSERFVADPLAPTPGERMYRTGDLARRRPDGTLDFLGRADDQVKIRGFRIEPGEIESVLLKQPGITQAAVVPRDDGPGGTMLVAYVVSQSGTTTDLTTLRRQLSESLPGHMVPGALVKLPRLPLTINGKLDRRALPAPLRQPGSGSAPETPEARTWCELFARVLKLEQVGADDDFFALGGHSLLAVRLISQARTAFGIELPIRTIFETPTPAGLADRLPEMRTVGPSLQRAPRPERLPLSPAQSRLWFLDQLEGPSATYNIPLARRFSGPLQVPRLQAALDAVVGRHEILRTIYPADEGEPRQEILSGAAVRVILQESDIHERDLPARLSEAAATPIRLDCEPPLKVWLFRVGVDQQVLLLVLHHIAGDGWSLAPLWQDLAEAYASQVESRPPAWNELPVQYADYTLWQTARLGSADDPRSELSRQARFWQEVLDELPDELSLPTDRPRPAVSSYRGGTLRFRIAADLHRRLLDLARDCGASLFMVLQGSLALLLSRMGAGDDIPIGSPIAGRNDRELEDLIGFFVNTLVLRTNVSGNPSFRELLARVREFDLRAYAHQDLPFDHLVQILQPVRSPARNPLFQILLVLQNAAADQADWPGLTLQPEPLDVATAKFDLLWNLTEQWTTERQPLGIAGELEFSRDLYDESTAAAFIDRLLRVLEQVTDAPQAPLHRLEILDPAERRHLLEELNATGHPVGVESLATLWEQQVARSPDAPAIECGIRTVSYSQLDARANQIGAVLARRGVAPECLVGVCLERSIDQVASLLAIFKVGAAYLPLDPSYPADRLSQILTDATPRVVLTMSDFSSRLPASTHCELLDTPSLQGELEAARDWSPPNPRLESPGPENHAAYIISTSGSTGHPKHIVVCQSTLINLLAWHALDGSPGRVAQFTSISFDVSLQEILWSLLTGQCLVIVDHDVRLQPDLLARFLSDQRITALFSTQFVLDQLFEAIADQNLTLPALQDVFQAGEALLVNAAARSFFQRHPACRLHNHYGPAETHVVTSNRLSGEPGSWPERPGIGTPLWNTRIYILDRFLEPLPRGAIGDLYIGGTGLARGYLGQPGGTAARFVADPWSPEPGTRMYRTGDLARWQSDGSLEFIGRSDQQVKIRGFRIEPGEIEAALRRQPGVAQAAVVPRHEQPGGTTLTAYIVPVAGTTPDLAVLRSALARDLPAYMIPGAFMTLPALPQTATGKLNRRSLPSPVRSRPDGRAPATTEESTLCRLFAQILHLDQVGVDESFFELGGHSLLATRLVSRVRTELDVELPIRAVFETPTPAGLARQLHSLRRARVPLRRQERSERPHLSAAQSRLWFLHHLEGASGNHNISLARRLRGHLNLPALQAALNDLVARHESLRTVFAEREGESWQQIIPASEARIPLVVERIAESELASRLAAAAGVAIEITRELPLRVWLLELASDTHVLVVILHHVAGDGWSLAPLWRDLMEAYAARLQDRAPDWRELSVQYVDYAIWQRLWLGGTENPGSELNRQLRFWIDALQGLPVETTLPTDRQRGRFACYQGGSVPLQINATLHRRLLGLAHSSSASLFMVLQAGLAALLSRLGAGDDIALGSPIAGREEQSLENLVGFFVNMLVLRTDLSGNPSVRELLTRVREFDLSAFAHQNLPFEQLVQALRPPRLMSRHPLFQVLLVLQNNEQVELSLPGIQISEESLEETTAIFDLQLSLTDQSGPHREPQGISGFLQYRVDLFHHETASRLVARYLQLLEQAVDHPDCPVRELDLFLPGERRRLVAEFQPPVVHLEAATLPELFERQVSATPDAVALVCGDESLTYAQLNRQANRLAQLLIARGLGPEECVGLCLERSANALVALLATVKAGAAYLPLDPESPPARLRQILDDARPRVVLTTRRFAPQIPDGSSVVLIDDPELTTWLQTASEQNPVQRRQPLRPQHPAYIAYTSGSTGTPKGVVALHAGVVRLVRDPNYMRLDPHTAMLHFAPLTFDAATLEIWGPLLNGGRVVIVPPGRQTAGELASCLDAGSVNTAWLTAGLFQVMVETELPAIARLEQLLAGGDVLSVDHVQRYLSAPGAGQLINGYGPTECTTFAACHPLVRTAGADKAPIPIGCPINQTQIYVLDDRLQPVPTGVPGELYIGGAGLARGYLNQPARTAERFVANPFALEPGSRMYRTGDLARWREDGTLEFLGRIDQQVKIRGFRIEPAEIEAVLLQQPDIRQAAVVPREDPIAGKTLVAYLVPQPGTGVSLEAVRHNVARRLPAYMTPAAYVELEALPLTPQGKLNRSALPAPLRETLRESLSEGLPRTDTERRLERIWGAVLQRERVGVEEDFFGLGGHSLLAIRLFSRIETEFGIKLPLESLFVGPTIASLARLLDGDSLEFGRSPLIPIRPGGSRPPLFALASVSGNTLFWQSFLEHLHPDQPVLGIAPPRDRMGRPRYVGLSSLTKALAESVTTRQPEGPLHLMGYSGGAATAYELAVELRRRGRTVEFLGLIDASPMGLELDMSDRLKLVPQFALNLWYWLCDNHHQQSFRSLRRRWQKLRQRLFGSGESKEPKHTPREELLQEFLHLWQDRPAPDFDGTVTLFRARCQSPWMFRPHDFGWGRLCSRVKVRIFAHCDHYGIIRPPHVHTLAEAIQEELDEAVRATGGPAG